ncbi:SDR family oxidoreductase [soil metagenome]
MDLGIRGRKAILAGASAGMGMESAIALAREGVEIYISARNEERLTTTADKIAQSTGAKVVPIVADHSTGEGRARLLETCPEPDILVITCSPPRFIQTAQEIEPDEWTSVLETTLVGPIELMRATVEGMAARGFGRVINIATIGAKTGNEMRVLSGAPRAALCNYTAAISRRLSRSNVSVNNILPGMFHTASMQERFDGLAQKNGTSYEIEIQKWLDEIGVPAGRFGMPEDVGAFCALLCSQYASYVIGQSIVIDGGQVRSVF